MQLPRIENQKSRIRGEFGLSVGLNPLHHNFVIDERGEHLRLDKAR